MNSFNMAWLTLTRNCNNKCKWCYASSNLETEKKEISIKKAKLVLNLFSDLGIKKTTLIGGEPTIYKDLYEILDYCKEKKIKAGFVTNGRRFSDRNFAAEIKKKGVDNITISIEGYNAKSHDSVTCVDGSYKQAIKGIQNAAEAGINVAVNTVISHENVKDLKKIVDSLKELPIKTFLFNVCGPCLTSNENNNSILKPIETAKAFEDVYLYSKERNLRAKLVTPHPLCCFSKDILSELKAKKAVYGGPCQVPFGGSFAVDYNGDIIPCPHFLDFPLMNLFRENKVISKNEFLKIYNSENKIPWNFRKIMKKYPSEKCSFENCSERCSGGCPIMWKVHNPEKEIVGIN